MRFKLDFFNLGPELFDLLRYDLIHFQSSRLNFSLLLFRQLKRVYEFSSVKSKCGTINLDDHLHPNLLQSFNLVRQQGLSNAGVNFCQVGPEFRCHSQLFFGSCFSITPCKLTAKTLSFDDDLVYYRSLIFDY